MNTSYIPSEVLFQNFQTMDMDPATLSSCMFVNKEWYTLLQEKCPEMIQAHFEQYEAVLGKKITPTNTSFALRNFYRYLTYFMDYVKDPSVEKLFQLHKTPIFLKKLSEEKALNTFHMLLNMMNYSYSVSPQTRDMVYLRMILVYQVFAYIQHILSSALHIFLQNKNFLTMIIRKGKEFEKELEVMHFPHPSLQKMAEDTTRMIRYTCRVVKPSLNVDESK